MILWIASLLEYCATSITSAHKSVSPVEISLSSRTTRIQAEKRKSAYEKVPGCHFALQVCFRWKKQRLYKLPKLLQALWLLLQFSVSLTRPSIAELERQGDLNQDTGWVTSGKDERHNLPRQIAWINLPVGYGRLRSHLFGVKKSICHLKFQEPPSQYLLRLWNPSYYSSHEI